jgi:hypothetical protein
MSNHDSREPGSTNIAVPDTLASTDQPLSQGTGRREFLKVGGLAFAAALLPEWLPGCGSPSGPAGVAEKLKVTSLDLTVDPTGWFEVVRPADMLRVRMNFVQLHHDVPSNTLMLNSGATSGVILIEFPPQHIDEQTVAVPPTPTPPVAAQIAGTSRVAFVVLPGTTVPYTLSGLLDACTRLTLNVAPNALGAADDTLSPPAGVSASTDPEFAIANLQRVTTVRGSTDARSDVAPTPDAIQGGTPPSPAQPADSQTSIELPYRVMVSPSSALRFAHSPTPYQPGTSAFTELWTSRLARSSASGTVDDSARVPVSARAVWSPDITSPSDPITSPTFAAIARAALAKQTSDFANAASTSIKTIPFHARRLMLSARGGSLDAFAEFPFGPSLLNWQHRASYGRDNYVRVELAGALFPWGHAASLITISERKFLPNANGGGGARTGYLWQQQFLVIRQPVVDYTDVSQYFGLYENNLRNFPFKQIRILTPSTPPLDPAPSPLVRFFPTINGGTAFRFAAQFVDHEDNVSQSEVAAIFMPSGYSFADAQAAATDFSAPAATDANGPRSACNFRRQRIAYARPADGTRGTTAHETQAMTFFGQAIEVAASFAPFMLTAEVNIPAARQFTGNDDRLTVKYPDSYTGSGFTPANRGEVYLAVSGNGGAQVDFGAQSQRAGGFMTPSMALIGFSRLAGPVSGAKTGTDTQLATFNTSAANDPTQMFAGAVSKAKLFGVFTLKDLFGGASLSHLSLPKFATEFLDEIGTFTRTLTQIQAVLSTLQSAAGSNLPAAFSGQVTSLTGHLQALASTLSTFPPGSSFASDAGGHISDIKGDLTALQGSVAQAWQTNNTLPGAARVPDVVFSQATSLLRAALAIASSGTQLTSALTALQNLGQAALNMTSHFTWQTQPGVAPSTLGDIQPIGLPGLPNIFNPKWDTVLKLTGEVRAHDVAGKPAGLDLTATLNDFDINLIGSGTLAFITVTFSHLSFTSLAGQKPNVDVGFSDITFRGPLTFLNELKKIIPLDGFGDPPSISITSKGIDADFSVALPALSVGVFTLENLSLGAQFAIPFIGEPMTVGFHFAERDNPFHLTVSLLGGGGHFLMDLSMQGVVLVEASLEFGAEASVNLVVASGTVLIMGGISLMYAPAAAGGGGVSLTGYVRIAGSLSVLGLISASVEMRMSLTYDVPSKLVTGSATISVEVSVLFFSESVDITVSKSFSACNADPIFADQMGPATPGGPLTVWDEYCAAFAA